MRGMQDLSLLLLVQSHDWSTLITCHDDFINDYSILIVEHLYQESENKHILSEGR